MRKSKPNQKKLDIVAGLQSKLDKAKAVFLTDYKGLSHRQLEDLRKILKSAEAELVVVKNTLLKKSLQNANKVPPQRDPASGGNKAEVFDFLKDSTAALFAYGDELSAIKKLYEFARNISLPDRQAGLPKVKIGLMGNQITSAEDFQRLAMLPTKDVLLSTLVYRLKSPLSGFHYALNWNLNKFMNVLNNIKGVKSQ